LPLTKSFTYPAKAIGFLKTSSFYGETPKTSLSAVKKILETTEPRSATVVPARVEGHPPLDFLVGCSITFRRVRESAKSG
jgi:hypothetical protein